MLKFLKKQYNDSLSFEIASVAHHGSNGNTNMDYINIIQCEKYLITANAENIHNLPNKETLRMYKTILPLAQFDNEDDEE